MIRRLLIANRGEIACRIMRTARQHGIECAVIHSDTDHSSLHVRMADAAYCVGPAPSSESYLNIDAIIAAARQWRADAIHPGYGFLSENADFATAAVEGGFIFVGPSARAIADMGSKDRARTLMQQAGIPVIPGFQADDGEMVDDEMYQQQAEIIGYPVLIKAVAGGGGRGLRVVWKPRDFSTALREVRREAVATSGSSAILLEKYLAGARHVEVQVFGDSCGEVIHLHERDCSVQRRHQKLIEEAPAPDLDSALRTRLGQAAVQAAKAIAYQGAGTVEFLLQGDQFWFMEMNTRLQVEHPVTEAITGLDLVDWQLRVASGEPLPLQQHQIPCRGHALEIRLNAEDPAADFLPSSGRLQQVRWPDAPGIRIETGFMAGDRVPVHYDSLLAKLIVHADTRTAAIRILAAALRQVCTGNLRNNAALLASVLQHPDFGAGPVSTSWLEHHLPELLEQAAARSLDEQVIARQGVPSSALRAWRNLTHNSYSRRYHLLGLPSPGHDTAATASADRCSDRIIAPLPGRVVSLQVSAGDYVEAGQTLLVMEAMKMEHALRASQAATVGSVHCAEGELVAPDTVLLTFVEEHKQ